MGRNCSPRFVITKILLLPMPNIRVEARIRPDRHCILEHTQSTITAGTKTYTFSNVHTSTTQKSLYLNSVQPFINEFISGFSCSIIAYGQTGSGKTYTMGISQNIHGAIIQHSLQSLFSYNLQLSCSFIEIYSEEIYDLLGESRQKLNIRSSNNELNIVGMKILELESLQHALDTLKFGCKQRSTGSTMMNTESSRSHAIFTVMLKRETDEGTSISKLAFVDLAGSERLKRTKCQGTAAKESISINSGLLALGNVINALYSRKGYVPYRDSKITRILESCLHTHVLLIACLSPLQDDLAETINTLKYAGRAASIQLRSKVVLETKDKSVILDLRKEISRLKDENNRMRIEINKNKGEIRRCPYVLELLERIKRLEIENEALKRSRFDRKEAPLEHRREVTFDNKKDVALTRREVPMEQSFGRNQALTAQLFRNSQAFGGKTSELSTGKFHTADTSKFHTADTGKFFTTDKLFGRQGNNYGLLRKSDDLEEQASLASKHALLKEIEELEEESNKHRRLVTFDLENKPKRKVFTPRKESSNLNFKLLGRSTTPVSLMTMRGGALIINGTDGRVWENSEEMRLLFTEDGINCIGSSEDRIYYGTRSLLKQYAAEERPIPLHAYKSELSAVLDGGNVVYTGHSDGTLNVLDKRNNKVLYSNKCHDSKIFDIKVINDVIYTCSRDHMIKYTEIRGTEYFHDSANVLMPPHYDCAIGLINYKEMLVSYSRDCSIKVWKDNRPYKAVPYAHESWIKSGVALENCWLTGCKDGVLRAWEIDEDRESVHSIGKTKVSEGINCMVGEGNKFWVGTMKGMASYEVVR